jgi:ATP-dependent RNA helicase DeaD
MKYTNKKILRENIPTIDDIETKKTEEFIEKLKNKIKDGNLQKYINIVEKLMEDDLPSIEVAAALLKMELELKNVSNLDLDTPISNNYGGKNVRMFINVGKNQKISPKDVVGAIAGETSIEGKNIGGIDIYDNYTYVEIPEKYSEEVLKIMQKNTIKGNVIKIEPAKPKRTRKKRRR